MSAQDPDFLDSQAVRRSQRSTRRRPSRYLDDDRDNVDVLCLTTEQTETLELENDTAEAENGEVNVDVEIDHEIGDGIAPSQDSQEQIPQGNNQGDRVRWGQYLGIKEIRAEVDRIYLGITTWQKNLLELPRRAKVSKEVIGEITRLLKLFNARTNMESIAIPLLVIFVPLILQKPSARSKNADHVRYLKKRLTMWKDGNLRELFSECEEIQKRIKTSKRKEEDAAKGFVRLMMEGKVRQALKLVNADTDVCGVHKMNDKIRTVLQEKHPAAEEAQENVLDDSVIPRVEHVVFENIGGSLVQKSAMTTAGSGGPSKVDAETWKNMLCSKAYGEFSWNLAEEVAVFARRLCTESIPSDSMDAFWACRLVPLMKEDDGVRPVGIGETLRRIVGKCVIKTLGTEVQMAAGTLQTCAGVESGIEAAIHAMAKTFQEDSCEAVILVDADNAFNRLNRKVALHNIERSCPLLHQFLSNSYKTPSKLHLGDGTHILSKEGVTQGDNLAMAKYAVGTKNLIESLKRVNSETLQVWFADDSAGAGNLVGLKGWWDHLNLFGPAYGYFPKPSKTYLILKRPDLLEKARELFGEEIKITTDGKRHIGAVIGTKEFKEEYVRDKIEKWIKDVTQLAEIARDEPQVALSAFNTGLSQRWKFVQRTIPEISHLFEPLESVIRSELIPALCGREISDLERRIFSLPYRYGGLGILNPITTAEREYCTSVKITAGLTNLICQQEMDLSLLDKEEMAKTKIQLKKEKEITYKEEKENIIEMLCEKEKRMLLAASEKGASSWLSALPLKKLGYVINKQEFRDAICLRYGWKIPNTPIYCGCGQKNSFDHILVCKKGGFVSMRHNILRDTEARMMEKVFKDVQVEPELLPAGHQTSGNNAEKARLDVSARGVWGVQEKTFFDIRVTHPNAESNLSKSLEAIYESNENQKKRHYNDRVLNVEKASFTPLVFSTTGGMGKECKALNKRLAEKISEKTKENYSQVMTYIRTRLRYALLKATLVAIRGFRGKQAQVSREEEIDEIAFNLIPEETSYETY